MIMNDLNTPFYWFYIQYDEYTKIIGVLLRF